MPSFLIGLLINFVLKFGVPAFVAWVKRRWGIDILPEEVQAIVESHAEQQKALHEDSKQKLKECTGIACPSDTKDL